ncbi:SDR family NAD(P)-dependent oxidoreductase [Streptomyces fuscichromogenes]|uniref:SDR family NAD(P)-dependent oxidoreductase n=1 Tax=Streptomyces fuscichromogenes TaxID=1324013 RepID=UPI0037FE293A
MNTDMTGKTVVITGASSGIGAVAARRLAELGATVVPVGRSPKATAAVAADLGVEPLIADYASLSEVRELAARLLDRCPSIDVLAHNAGLMTGTRCASVDGFELTLQVNYLAPFLLQHLLHERLSASRAHIVVTSSMGHWNGRIALDDLNYERRRYTPFSAYCDSKLADLVFARETARRTSRTGITAVAFHPGVVNSGLAREARGPANLAYNTRLGRALTIDEEKGAEPLVHLAAVADPHSVNGQYFHRLRPDARTSTAAREPRLARALWVRTADMLGLPAQS